MRAHDRTVAGIRCTEVLAVLADYVDGELEPAQVRQVEAHLAGCDWCERFGGDYMEVVTALRSRMADPGPVPAAVQERLVRRVHGAS